MKGKVGLIISTFITYSLIFLIWHNWSLDRKQIAELIFIGTLSSLALALVANPMTRLMNNVIETLLKKK